MRKKSCYCFLNVLTVYSKIGQVIFYLLFAQRPEPRANCTLDTLVAQQIICGITDNTCCS